MNQNNISYEGTIKTCPSCGKFVPSFTTNCQCGFEFRQSDSVLSMSQLYNQIKSTNDEDKKVEIIRNFPIPNNKEDLLEFVSVSASNALPALNLFSNKSTIRIFFLIIALIVLCWIYNIGVVLNSSPDDMIFGICLIFGPLLTFGYIKLTNSICKSHREDRISKAWQDKFHAVYNKLSIINGSNNTLLLQSSVPINQYFKKKKFLTGIYIGIIIFTVISFGLAIFLTNSYNNEVRQEEEINEETLTPQYEAWKEDVMPEIEEYYLSLQEQLISLPVPTTSNYQECIRKLSSVRWIKSWPVPTKYKKLADFSDQDDIGRTYKSEFKGQLKEYQKLIGEAWGKDLKNQGYSEREIRNTIPYEYR